MSEAEEEQEQQQAAAATAAAPVLVYGARGWIGGLLLRAAEQQGLRCVAAQSRAHDAPAVRAELARVRPRLVFAALGRTHGAHDGVAYGTIDYLEQPGKLPENLRDNLVAPVTLAALCRDARVPFASIATGCIFEADARDIADDARPGFGDDAAPNFVGSSYSVVKGATDTLLRLHADTALWFRIRMPITHDLHPRSFLTKIASYDKVCSVPNSMSVLDGPHGLLALFLRMALAGYTGCYNGCNPNVMTHDEILALYRERVDPAFAWANFSLAEQSRVLAAGRSNNRLDARKLQAAAAELGVRLPPLREAVCGVLDAVAASRRSRAETRPPPAAAAFGQ